MTTLPIIGTIQLTMLVSMLIVPLLAALGAVILAIRKNRVRQAEDRRM